MNIKINMNNNNKIYLNENSCSNIIDNKLFAKSPFSLELETIKVTKRKKIFYPKKKIYTDISNKKNSGVSNQNLKHNNINTKNTTTNNTTSKDKNNYLDSLVHTSSNSNNQNDEIINNVYAPTSTINYANNTKKDLILEELYKKKNIILPLKKEINNININVNGYTIHGGSLTSRTSNNVSKKKNKNQNNIMTKKEGNPVKIKKISEKMKNKNLRTNKSSGFRTLKKK